MLRCFSYIGRSVEGVTSQDKELLLQARMISERQKATGESRLAAATTLFYHKIAETLRQNRTRLLVLFTHDNHQIAMVRTMLGLQDFLQVFEKEVRVPFLSSLRLTIEDNLFKASLNEEHLNLTTCNQNDNKCTTDRMMTILQPYMMPYE